MEELLQRIEKYIGTDEFNRIKEIMGIIGCEFPEKSEVYRKGIWGLSGRTYSEFEGDPYQNYTILLSVPAPTEEKIEYAGTLELDELGYLEFKRGYSHLAVKKDGVFYEWRKNGNYYESFDIHDKAKYSGAETSAALVWKDEGLYTGHISLKAGYLIADLDNVTNSNNKETVPLDNMLDMFTKIMNDPTQTVQVPQILREKGVAEKLIRVFTRPINDFVSNLKTTNQTWRFDRERQKIESEHKVACDKEDRDYKQAKADLKSDHTARIKEFDAKKDADLSALSVKESAYRARVAQDPALRLTQDTMKAKMEEEE